MRRVVLACVCAVLVMVTAAASAQAAPKWEVRLPGPWKVLPAGGSEKVKITGSLGMEAAVNYSSNYNFKDVCSVTGELTIFNPTTGGPGQDIGWPPMRIVCPANGLPPEPCASGEGFTLTQINEWPSVLRAVGLRDEFKNVSFEIECASSVKGIAPALGGIWSPKLGVNKLTFSPASGVFESLGTEFVFLGSLALKPAFFAFVR
jgi:hypothetical protein